VIAGGSGIDHRHPAIVKDGGLRSGRAVGGERTLPACQSRKRKKHQRIAKTKNRLKDSKYKKKV
jgi:hypothetical protein